MKHDDRVAVVVFGGKKRLRLNPLGGFGQRRQLFAKLGFDRLPFAPKFNQGFQVGDAFRQLAVSPHSGRQTLALPHHGLALFGVVPETGIGDLLFDFF